MSERSFLSQEKISELMSQSWQMGWEAHEAFINAAQGSNRRSVALGDAGDALGPQIATDGICTCPEVPTGSIVARSCLRHGPGGIEDCFRPTTNADKRDDGGAK